MRPGRYQDGGKGLGRPGYEGTTRSVRISINMGAMAWGGLVMRPGWYQYGGKGLGRPGYETRLVSIWGQRPGEAWL